MNTPSDSISRFIHWLALIPAGYVTWVVCEPGRTDSFLNQLVVVLIDVYHRQGGHDLLSIEALGYVIYIASILLIAGVFLLSRGVAVYSLKITVYLTSCCFQAIINIIPKKIRHKLGDLTLFLFLKRVFSETRRWFFRFLRIIFNTDARYTLSDDGGLTNQAELSTDDAHRLMLKRLREKHRPRVNDPSTGRRTRAIIFGAIISVFIAALLLFGLYHFYSTDQTNAVAPTFTNLLIQPLTLLIGAPVAFVVWRFRDENKIFDILNARKDTNLKEFQQLQAWATGNIPQAGHDPDGQNALTLRISALHQLRAYLKGTYGEDFRRPAFEIFRSVLRSTHQQVLRDLLAHTDSEMPSETTDGSRPPEPNTNTIERIENGIEADELARQLNQIVREEWFSLLMDHDFPLDGISLVGAKLEFAYLSRVKMPRADLRGANLFQTQLQGAYLYEANLQSADLIIAELQGTCLINAELQGAYLTHANLRGADLLDADLQGAYLHNAKLQDTDLINANLRSTKVFEANLQGAELRFANLQGAYLEKTNLQGANLYEANLQGTYLEKAQLQGAYLEKAQLQGAYLGGANLRGANLYEANLQGANFRESNLQGANLLKANLQGANLFFANLQGANLSMTYIHGADLTEANFFGAISNCKMIRSSSFEETLTQCANRDADLSGIDRDTLTHETCEDIVAVLNESHKKYKILDVNELNQRVNALRQQVGKAPDFSQARLGRYSTKDAKTWIQEYKAAMKDVPKRKKY